ncbi:hypothetical protein MLD38_039182 [Melastoma candidum]|uniref:Uncharacterized protein n=1 Tax=Melastoma candidum TaxID=119954 RepID=A0ACB9L2B9_9MYRT|nr:hypothetical protein MLD38_039182 [Melastoma candidum]
MKFMKLGSRPDSFYTEAATRTVASEVPADLILRAKNTVYHLHKFLLLPKCGLLQQLCINVDKDDPAVDISDIPGGEDAFELCAKYCYGISINLSAHNFFLAFCAAKYLRMTELVEKGNLLVKLEAFFNSCILEGWKDSVATLQTTSLLAAWSDNLGIARRCIDAIVEKILAAPNKVTWSFTYSRPDYNKKQQQAVPRDWWTEDVSDLDLDLFRCIITAIRSTNVIPPQLIGEALHVYACRWLPDTTKARLTDNSASQSDEFPGKSKRILEAIVGMIPAEPRSVSIRFLFRLLSIANYLSASQPTRAELIRRCSHQLAEAAASDLVFPSQSSRDEHFYDVDLVQSVTESFGVLWRRQPPGSKEMEEATRTIRRVGKLVDSYLQVISKDANLPVSKLVSLAESVPEVGRPEHDDLYKAINIFLKEHPDLSKSEKKDLCRILDGQKLSPAARAHAIKNERLPLRTVVQVLYFDQEKGSSGGGKSKSMKSHEASDFKGKEIRATGGGEEGRRRGASSKGRTATVTPPTPDSSKLEDEFEKKLVMEEEVEEAEEVEEEELMTGDATPMSTRVKSKPVKMPATMGRSRSRSDQGSHKGGDR